ncbi:NifB/NifX family molybdenum-iron cluster-binding protein [Pontiellaceae bacterium B12227]|nr:NifB/NifX family molybdenum-iron cluster-binding protein [Pontiellaceae bacterium B12227]
MKAAITEWQNRVAPVFDVAGTVLLIETDAEELQESISLPSGNPRNKIAFLKEQEVDVLICGAITRRMREYAEELGIRINPFVSGEIDEVWDAWRNGTLDQACYSMPGCRRCRRRKGQCS